MKIQPTLDNVAISLDERTESAGGIALPNGAKAGPATAVVVAIGPGREVYSNDENGKIVISLSKPIASVGDRVLLSEYAFNQSNALEIDRRKVMVITCSSILAIIKE